MPYNKNGIHYELYDSPKKDEQGRNILCAKVVSGGTVEQKDLERMLHENWSVKPSDTQRFMTAFVDAVASMLADGHRVNTIFGSFYTKLALDAPYTADDKVSAIHVSYDGIGFLPDKKFTEMVAKRINGFYRDRGHRSAPLGSKAEMERRIRKLVREKGGVFDLREFRLAFGVSEYMARKTLKALCEGDHPLLLCQQKSRGMIYMLA